MSDTYGEQMSTDLRLIDLARVVLPPEASAYADLLDERAPDAATSVAAQRGLRALVALRATGGDLGAVALVLALTLAARYPAALADPALADVAADLIAAWWATLLALETAPFEYRQKEVIAARMNHLLAQGAVFNALPTAVVQPVLDALWAAVAEDDAGAQNVAVRALQAMSAHVDVERVGALVAQHDEGVCKNGLALAGVLGDRAPVDAMLTALRRDAVKWEAAQALIALGDHAPIDPLLDVVAHHPNRHMRTAVAKALHTLADRVPVEAILPAIRDDPNALLPWSKHIPITDLLLALFHSDYALHLLLPKLVARRTEIPLKWLNWLREKQSAPECLYAMRILFEMGEPVDAALVQAALAPRHTEQYRAEGLRLLGLIGDPASVAFLERLLADEQDWLSAAAAEALGLLGDRTPLAPLIAALDAPTVTHPPQRGAQVRAAAARALLAQGTRVPRAVWLAHLDERITDVHLIAAQALAAYEETPSAEIVPLLWRWQRLPLRGLHAGNSRDADRDFAAALRALAPHIGAAALLAAATDEQAMRACAAAVLGVVGDAASRAALLVATHDATAEVRLAALCALGEHLGLDDLRRLAGDDDTQVRTAAIALLATRHARPAADLIAQAQAPQRDVYLAALRALGPAAPVDLLLGRLTDARDQIDLDILDLLAALDAPAARDAVLALRQRTGNSYLTALGHLGDLAPLDILREALYDNSWYTSGVEAITALLRLGQLGDDADPALLAQVGQVLANAADSATQPIHRGGFEYDVDTYCDLLRLVQQLPPVAGMAVLAAFARGDTEYAVKQPPLRQPTDQEIARIITKTLSSRQFWVRACAALVLRGWRGRVTLDPIVAALADPDNEVRATAAWLLGYMGAASVIAPLRELVDDPYAGRTVAIALRRLGVTAVVVPAVAKNSARQFVAPLADVDDDQVESANEPSPATLLDELGAVQFYEKAGVIRVLGQRPLDLPVATRLTWALGDEWDDVRQAALDVLRERAPAALAALAPAARATLRGTPTGVFASLGRSHLADFLALARPTAPDYLALLADLLAWPYFPVRLHAARAAATLPGPLPHALLRRLADLCRDTESAVARGAADDALAAQVRPHRDE